MYKLWFYRISIALICWEVLKAELTQDSGLMGAMIALIFIILAVMGYVKHWRFFMALSMCSMMYHRNRRHG